MGTLLPAPHRATRVVALAAGIPFLTALVVLTLSPSRPEDSVPGAVDRVLHAFHGLGWTWMDFAALEALANVLLFVPVGVLACLLVPRRAWPLAFAAGPALSIAIEGAQALVLPQRAATVSDLLANSAGASLGVLAALVVPLLLACSARPVPSPTLEAS